MAARRERRAGKDTVSRGRKPWLRRWLSRLFWLWVILMLLSALPVLALRWLPPPGSAYMLARMLDYRAEGRAQTDVQYLWRDFEAISPWLAVAVIAAEDQRFPDHLGFDLVEIERALEERRERGRVRGASTISQQLARNLFLWSGQTYVRKGLEAWFTVLIEATWPKRRVLEVYLNIAEFGDGIYGAEAAAQHHFGRPAGALDRRQSALLAAVLPSPRRRDAGRPDAALSQRAEAIEMQMRQLGGQSLLDRL